MSSFPIGLPAAALYRLLFVFLTRGLCPTGLVPLATPVDFKLRAARASGHFWLNENRAYNSNCCV